MDLMPRRAHLASMVRLSLPIVTVQVGMMFMGVVDTMMVGRLSAIDLAAVALGNAYFYTIAVFGIGMLMALDPIVAQAVGAEDPEGIARGMQRGFVLTLFLALAASVLFLPSRAVFVLLRQPGDVVPVAAGYIFGSIPGMFPFYAFVVLRQSLQALGARLPDRADHRGRQPPQRPSQLGAHLRESGLSADGRRGLGLGLERGALVHGRAAAGPLVVRGQAVPLPGAARGL